MQHFHDEIRIEAPVEHVWAYLSDGSHLDDIAPRARHTDFSGPLDQVGTTFVATGRMMGLTSRSTFTVVEVEPRRLCRIRPEPGAGEMAWRLEPEGEGTRLAFDTDYDVPGHLPGFLTGFLAKGWERDMHRMLSDVKAFTEATVPAPA
jgi:ligand-binding SRPBCC domain-containing protein